MSGLFFRKNLSKWQNEVMPSPSSRWPMGSFINDIMVIGGRGQGFCDGSTKVLVIKITPSLSYHWRYRGFPLNSVFLEASEVTKDSEILEISEVSRWLGGLEVSDNSKVVEVSEAEKVSFDTFSYPLVIYSISFS